MPVAIEMDFPGATLEQYDQVMEKMGLTGGGSIPPGAIFHWVAATPEGIRVVDVWETREAFEKFAQEQIGPKTREVGIEGEPQTRIHEVHNHLKA